jgi:hypothetical protein
MKVNKICAAIPVFISLILIQCENEKDPGLLTSNGTIKGHVTDMVNNNPIPGAMIKIWINDERDTIKYYTDESGYYETEKLIINTGIRYKVEASKPDYEVTAWNGIDPYEEAGSPGKISAGPQFPDMVVEFKLSPIVLGYQIIPDSLFFRIKYDPSDPTVYSWLQLTILNTGTGPLNWKIHTHDPWIEPDFKDPVTVNEIRQNEFSMVDIGVKRTTLSPGNYSGSVEITIGNIPNVIPVDVTVY